MNGASTFAAARVVSTGIMRIKTRIHGIGAILLVLVPCEGDIFRNMTDSRSYECHL